jgi:hypothetical protein
MKLRTVFILHPSSFILVFVLLIVGVGSLDVGLTYFGDYVRQPQLYYESDGDLVDIADRLNAASLGGPVYVHALHYRHPTLAALARNFHDIRSITGPDVLVFPPGPSLQVFAHLALDDRDWRERVLPASARVEAVTGPDGQTSFEWVQVDAPPSIQPQVALGANFGSVVKLLGFDLNATPRSGEEVDVTLYWQVRNPPDRGDYSLFAELRDSSGYAFEWGRADSFDYPAEQWTPGETIVQRLRVPIGAGAPPGSYQLRVGWYSAPADKRLPIVPGGGFRGTTAPVGPIQIAPAVQPPDEDALGMGTRLDRRAVDGLTLLGASVQTGAAQPSAPFFFTLFWRADRELAGQLIEIRMRDPASGRTLRMVTHEPAYPFHAWETGEVLADRYGVRVPDDAEPGGYVLEVRVGEGDWIEFGHMRVEAAQRRFDVPSIAHSLQASFGDQIELLGYNLDRASLRAGETISLTLVWRALKTPDADYTVFTHLLDASGVQRGGKDNPPVYGTYDTSLWVKDEVVVDNYVISPDANAPPGTYTLEIGLYRFETGARLPLSTGGDALRLATIEVAP